MGLSIAIVARETGLSAATLRKWEQRFGFPKPERTPGGTRRYSPQDVAALIEIRRLLLAGARPAEVFAQRPWCRPACGGQARPQVPATIAPLFNRLQCNDIAGLEQGLLDALRLLGVRCFVDQVAAPLTEAVGEGWFNGCLSVHQEHLYTQALQVALRCESRITGGAAVPPRFLLATLPGEAHTLGLEMLHAVLVDAGATSIQLGAQLPLNEIAAAAHDHRIDVVGLSFSRSYPRSGLESTLQALRDAIPAQTELWVGGGGCRTLVPGRTGVRVMQCLDEALRALVELRGSLHA